MVSGDKPRVKMPDTAAAGAEITIKTLIPHPMESGQRKDSDGNTIPRSIINRFTCEFNGESVIDVRLDFEFAATVPEAGVFSFTWYADDGSVYETAQEIAIG